jgi:2-polyprenyl-6-methoxyphenol hydroxylase-like FAD-dependent oxidoreductase
MTRADYDLLIIGGGMVGASLALRTGRSGFAHRPGRSSAAHR